MKRIRLKETFIDELSHSMTRLIKASIECGDCNDLTEEAKNLLLKLKKYKQINYQN